MLCIVIIIVITVIIAIVIVITRKHSTECSLVITMTMAMITMIRTICNSNSRHNSTVLATVCNGLTATVSVGRTDRLVERHLQLTDCDVWRSPVD